MDNPLSKIPDKAGGRKMVLLLTVSTQKLDATVCYHG